MADRKALIEHIAQTQREVRRQVAQDHAHPLLAVNLTMTQLKVMIQLSLSGGASGQDLARRAGVGLATMTGIIDRLVAQGQVSRQEDPADRRVRRLALTPAGEAAVEHVLAAGEQYREQLLQRLDLTALQIVAQAFDLILGAVAGTGPAGAAPVSRALGGGPPPAGPRSAR
jgi:DNA-binding MarR family transcriptional regulator